MRPGRVIHARINPEDAMSVVDILDKLGLTAERFSFDAACRIVLSSLLESVRVQGGIPRRQGFEYSTLMQRFQERVPRDRIEKLVNTSVLDTEGSKLHIRAAFDDPVRRRRFARYEELAFKFEQDPTNRTEEEKAELVELTNELFPDPDLQASSARESGPAA